MYGFPVPDAGKTEGYLDTEEIVREGGFLSHEGLHRSNLEVDDTDFTSLRTPFMFANIA